MAMVKTGLVRRIVGQRPDLLQRDVEMIVHTMLEAIIAGVAAGDRVEIRGFGIFSVRPRSARPARNPRTGELVSVEKKFVPHFKSGREMRRRLNAREV
jgi:integration host factor subunit beta